MKTTIIGACLLTLTFTACKKDDDNPNCPNTMTALAGTYKPVKYELGLGGGSFLDVTSSLNTCQTDDRIILEANGTTTYQDAGTACTPSGTDTGTWSIAADGKVSISAGNVDVTDAQISSWDCTTLVVVATDSSGTSGRITLVK